MTLAEWERRYAKMQPPALSGLRSLDINWNAKSRTDYALFPELASAIRFAMEFDCPRILPAAFYELARGGDIVDWDQDNLNVDEYRPAHWNVLHAEGLVRVLKGRQQILRKWKSIADKLDKMVNEGCQHTVPIDYRDFDKDSSDCEQYTRKRLEEALGYPTNPDPLGFLRGMEDSEAQNNPVPEMDIYWCCTAGRIAMRRGLRQEAKNLWDSLPEIFDLKELLERNPIIR